MRSRFTAFDPARHGRRERFEQLRTIFHVLLMKSGGDADQSLEWLEVLGERHGWFDDDYGMEDFRRDLLESGEVKRSGPGTALTLTGKGERALRSDALERIFSALAAEGPGDHGTGRNGGSGEDLGEVRPYAWGDAFEDVAWTPTLRNALGRSAAAGDPASFATDLREEDFEIREREKQSGCATVLLIDVSHSMILYGEDRMMPAREVALALFELVNRQFKKDTLDLVLFGDDAELVPLDRIPYIQAGPFHTNTKAGLELAQDLLRARHHVNKQIFMITDGKPSAIHKDGGIYKNPFGLDEEIVNRTLDEAVRCRRAGIQVTTFMVARDPMLVGFVEEFTELNRGRAYFTGTDGLGSALFVDYMRNRRTRV